MANINKIAVFFIVALVALIGLVLIFRGMTGSAVYQQPGYDLPLYLHTSKVIEDFDICGQYQCAYGFAETEPAFFVGVEELTGNLRCGCIDGKTFIVRPDLIQQYE